MLTKQILRESIEALIKHQKTCSKMLELGVDLTNSELSSIPYDIFENMLLSHFDSETAETITEWVYDRVFDIQSKYGEDVLDVKSAYIMDNADNVLVDDFESLCEFYSIKDKDVIHREDDLL